jgi:ParB family chromosome partitioning protein
MEKRRLGRGLDALIGNTAMADGTPDGSATDAATPLEQTSVPLERIQQNPFQPRQSFDEDELSALSNSLRTHGLLQPLVVRPFGDQFQLVAGERRLRAARAAGWTEVPVRVVNFNDQEVLEAALVENIQRSDLNPIEKAQGFKDYLDRFHMTHEQLAERLGLDRSTLTNLMRLLDLPAEVQEAVRVGQISAGHARALAALSDRERQVTLCKEIITRGHSVRATELLVKEQKPEAAEDEASRRGIEKTAHVQAIEDELRQKLATRVQIRLKGKDKGQLVLGFDSNDDFERLLEILRK